MLERIQEILCVKDRERVEELEKQVTELKDKNEESQLQIDDKERQISRLEDDLSYYQPSVDVETKNVEPDFIADALRTIDGWENISHRRPMNSSYRVMSRDDFDRIVEEESVSMKEYELDYFDCVDFTGVFRFGVARRYNVNSIGLVITYAGTPHAFNIIVFDDGTAELFEPQSDRFIEPGESEMYDIEDAVVHF